MKFCLKPLINGAAKILFGLVPQMGLPIDFFF
jgi:hypothetical protein